MNTGNGKRSGKRSNAPKKSSAPAKMSLDGATQGIWNLFTWLEPGVSLSASEVAGIFLARSTFWAASRLDKLEVLGLVVANGDRYSLQDPEQMSAATRALYDQLAAENGLTFEHKNTERG